MQTKLHHALFIPMPSSSLKYESKNPNLSTLLCLAFPINAQERYWQTWCPSPMVLNDMLYPLSQEPLGIIRFVLSWTFLLAPIKIPSLKKLPVLIFFCKKNCEFVLYCCCYSQNMNTLAIRNQEKSWNQELRN